MKIIITMAGLGSRFRQIGINKPKYEIIANNKSLFEWSMDSLEDFFEEEFIFVCREEILDYKFIETKCNLLGIKQYNIVTLNELTDGQASTAFNVNHLVNDNDSCLIYNIDTYVNPMSIKREDILDEQDGFIPVVVEEGDRWSFVRVDNKGKVVEVAEKRPISNLASIGLYYFKEWRVYKEIYLKYKEEIKLNNKEVYIAPMYQYMIDSNLNIGIKILDKSEVKILGTPEEIKEFDYSYLSKNI